MERSIVNHMYYVAATAPAENRLIYLRDMWLSVENHTHDMHTHNSEAFPYCDHVPLLYDREKEWLVQGSTGSSLQDMTSSLDFFI